jgi:small subunit ribosomal protein S6
MQMYELTLVVAGGSSAAKKKPVLDRIEKLVKIFKGNVKESNDWGEIELSYRIKKETHGHFLNLTIEMEPADAKALAEKIRVEEDIVRHLMVKPDRKKVEKVKKEK